MGGNWSPYTNIALIYIKWHLLDSALFYAKESYEIITQQPPQSQVVLSAAASTIANVYEEKGDFPLAQKYLFIGIASDNKFNNATLIKVRLFNNVARYYKKIDRLDSCIYYAGSALRLSRNHQFGEQVTDAATLVAESYELLGKLDSALKYTKIFIASKDTIFNQSKLIQIQLLNFDEGQRQKDIQRAIEQTQERYATRIRYFALLVTAGIFLLISLILFRNNRNKQIANKALESQKTEIDQQRAKAENALDDLRSTQALLIQSEKMASLGEMTAGIAHEIQNPLNFVNNFAQVNEELIDEAGDAIKAGKDDEAIQLLNNLRENQIKINHHGQRAESIVKGMLQHSRISIGQKEPTDFNMLVDEYVRLSYHGLRAKDKEFNATIKTDFDATIDKINITPQDIGRVFLNLYNNAFYAVTEKKKQNPESYEPTVTVTTKKVGSSVEVKIKDNGNGIPEKVLAKIFQPFFTTKPSGQGTGLGLSMSYDIVKAHGGEIKVETKEGEYTRFTVILPNS